jgi:hypothetical protein
MKTITTIGLTFTIIMLAALGVLMAQPIPQGADPIFWCDLSRSQVSHERDASLAQIEMLKYRNAALEARIKELEAKAQESKAEPHE